MTTFLRLLNDKDKQAGLLSRVRAGGEPSFVVDPTSFRQIPGAPFAYWVSEAVRGVFNRVSPLQTDERVAVIGA